MRYRKSLIISLAVLVLALGLGACNRVNRRQAFSTEAAAGAAADAHTGVDDELEEVDSLLQDLDALLGNTDTDVAIP